MTTHEYNFFEALIELNRKTPPKREQIALALLTESIQCKNCETFEEAVKKAYELADVFINGGKNS